MAYRNAVNDIPIYSAAAVTPNDSTVLRLTAGLWVGGAGNINVRLADGSTVLFSGVPAGTRLNFSVDKVLSTNTTATLIVALYV